MDNQISFSGALYDIATSCVIRRKKHHCKFRSPICSNCKYYVCNYIDADPRHVNLFMFQAEKRAYRIKTNANSHRKWCVLGIIISLLLAWYYHNLGVERGWHEPFIKLSSAPQQSPRTSAATV